MPRTCKQCKIKFEPQYNSVQLCCSYECAIEYAKAQADKKKNKEWKNRKKKIKEGLKTHQDYVRELQVIFNTYIRLRDKDKSCICCPNEPLVGKYDAGHYFGTGTAPELRFDEDNVHAQRVLCNQHKHGNLIEYTENLPKRIGQERFEALKKRKGVPKKYSIPELILLKEEYKEKVRQLKQ